MMRRSRVGMVMLALFMTVVGGAMFGNGARGLAQEASPPRPSHIHAGDCDELKEVVQPLTALTVPSENVRGNADAVVAEAAFTNIPQTLDELLASDHSVKVHLSKDEITVYLVCGDIGGAVDANGALIVGLKELDGSGYTGIAYLAPGPNGGTDVSVMIAKVLPGGGAGDDTAGATTGNAGGAATELSVSLTEFAIATETTAPAGAIVFNISNDGAAPHSFVIEGEGIKKQLGRNLQPGESTTLEVTLSPGVYTIYCPVGEGKHRANGMEVELTVE